MSSVKKGITLWGRTPESVLNTGLKNSKALNLVRLVLKVFMNFISSVSNQFASMRQFH